jgi:hypothetical protein
VLLTPPISGQRCHGHSPPLVSGVIDTTDHKKSDLKVEYLGEYAYIYKTALTCGALAEIELFAEKNRRSKIS